MEKYVVPFKKSDLSFDFTSSTLVLSHKFHEKAAFLGGEEFRILDEYREKFPDLRIVVKAPAKRKKSSSFKLSYNKMLQYISYQENAGELVKEFNKARGESLATKSPYKYVEKWFKNKFPAFGDCTAMKLKSDEVA